MELSRMETICPLSRAPTIRAYGAVRTFSGVGLGSATMHSACAECAAPNSAKPKKAKIILRMSFKFLFLSYFSNVADTMIAAIIVAKTARRQAFRREGCQ